MVMKNLWKGKDLLGYFNFIKALLEFIQFFKCFLNPIVRNGMSVKIAFVVGKDNHIAMHAGKFYRMVYIGLCSNVVVAKDSARQGFRASRFHSQGLGTSNVNKRKFKISLNAQFFDEMQSIS